jgi:RNA polymerase sigma factor for flagellar operon FliA
VFDSRRPAADPATKPGVPLPRSGTASTAAATAVVDVHALITQNLPLVGHLARETAARLPRHLGTDDLIGAGSLALVQAAHAFDPSLGVPFNRFANTRVRGAMIDQMRQRDWATRSLRSRARAIATATEHLTAGLGRAPSDTELASASGLSEAELREVRAGTDRAVVLSLDPVAAEDEGLGAGVVDGAPRPEEALIAAERMGYLRDAIAELPERLRDVVTSYYLQQQPLTEIAERLGVTQSRASQLRSEGLDLLREALQTLWDSTPSGPAQATGDPGGPGVRARRRDAYVQAVATRSTPARRANVSAYLNGNSLDSAFR